MSGPARHSRDPHADLIDRHLIDRLLTDRHCRMLRQGPPARHPQLARFVHLGGSGGALAALQVAAALTPVAAEGWPAALERLAISPAQRRIVRRPIPRRPLNPEPYPRRTLQEHCRICRSAGGQTDTRAGTCTFILSIVALVRPYRVDLESLSSFVIISISISINSSISIIITIIIINIIIVIIALVIVLVILVLALVSVLVLVLVFA